MNKVELIGNLCKDHDIKVMQGTDKKVLKNTIAVRRDYKSKTGEYESDFIPLVIYGATAEYADKYLKKGDKVGIVGKWQHGSYETQDGIKKYFDQCIVESIEILTFKAKSYSDIYERVDDSKEEPKVEPKNDNPWGIDDDELPF